MLKILSKEEEYDHIKKLRKFTKENHCEMYSYMLDVKNFRFEGVINERQRIIRLIKKIKIDEDLKKKIIVKIMEQPNKKLNKIYKQSGIKIPTTKNNH